MTSTSKNIDRHKLQDILNDRKRLETLNWLDLLDSAAEVAFDRLTTLASKLVDAPVSLVTLVDKDRQYFKSCVGLQDPWACKRETPLSHSFCQYVVASGQPLIVEDAREDPILQDNLAIPDLNVIGYLGMPLVLSNGTHLGSFCVIDTKPRKWTYNEIYIIHELSQSVMTEIELRAEVKLRKESEAHLQATIHQAEQLAAFADEAVHHLGKVAQRDANTEETQPFVTSARQRLDEIIGR